MRRSLIIAAAAFTLVLPAFAGAATKQINVRDDFFSPENPRPRDFSHHTSFRWTTGGGTSNEHNIRQNAGLFSSGPLTDNPIDFSINPSAGSFGYYCTLHGSRSGSGMAGRVEVRPVLRTTLVSDAVGVRWADSNTNTGSHFDVRYRVDQREWQTWKNDTHSFNGLFGRNDHPVDFRPSRHIYRIQVRSERNRLSRHSDWSPVLRLE